MSFMDFILQRQQDLMIRLAEHLLLTGMATSLAAVLGVAIALLAFRIRWLQGPLMSAVSLLQTIPGIALLVLMLAVFQRIGMIPALVALVLYALLPIARNTLTGLLSTPPTLAEAARALGMTRWQQLYIVRIPLAMPSIISGLRTAAVQSVGLATLAAFVGAGGLGQFINRGLFLSDTRLILLGAIPAALIALLTDFTIAMLQYGLFAYEKPKARRRYAIGSSLCIMLVLLLFTVWQHPFFHHRVRDDQAVIIGSKNFTEQLIVAEIVAQLIERDTDIPVIRRFSLGGTQIMHQAIAAGEITLAVEYTGTALTSVLHLPTSSDPREVFSKVARTYADRYQITWLPPLGFNNTYVLAVRKNDPRLSHVSSLTQLTGVASGLSAGFDFEFAERPDGYAGLRAQYGLKFLRVSDIHPDLLYDILKRKEVDVISAYATDGRLADPAFRILRDDQHFFPPYDAAIMVRNDTLNQFPALKPLLIRLSGMLSDQRMRILNAKVDTKTLSPREAAAEFLRNVTQP